MSKAVVKYTALKEQMNKTREELKRLAKTAFTEMAKELFEEHPGLVSFGWTQYTPYFNDGDECVFSAHTDYIHLDFNDPSSPKAADDDDGNEEDFEDDEDEEFGSYDAKGPSPKAKAGRQILEFLSTFDNEDYKHMFGDHVRVTVDKKGVSADEYSHD